jgi:ribosomal protein S6--L-glutamate ligase
MNLRVGSLPLVALGRRLNRCVLVKTLGVRPNFSDYSDAERELILSAEKIYYPTRFYAELFDAMGKKTFPGYPDYQFAQDKIKQSALFSLLDIQHPNTRVFYGKKQKTTILDYFQLPVVAKKPRGSSMGRDVLLIRDRGELARYCSNPWPAYIQEYLAVDRDIRVVVIGRKVRHAYWRVATGDDFRTNVSAGGAVDLSPVPERALELAAQAAELCRWDDVGIDIIEHHGRFYLVEANMKYGLSGFKAAGIDYFELMTDLIRHGEI